MTQKFPSKSNTEEGFALLMVVFILSLATILVTAFSSETFAFIRTNRSMTDGLQAELAAKSALSIAIGVLEVPDDISLSIQPWQAISALPNIPVPGFDGDVRIQIIDQGGKINVNAIVPISDGLPTSFGNTNTSDNESTTDDPVAEFWKGTLFRLFTELMGSDNSQGNVVRSTQTSQSTSTNPFSNLNLGPDGLVAVLHDAIDRDSIPHQSQTFPGVGIESNDTRSFFPNHPLTSMDDLIEIPGISRSMLVKLAPYLRASYATDSKINVNTATPAVLKALGMTDVELNGIIDKRGVAPITPEELQTLVQGSQNLSNALTTISNSYRILIRAKTVSVTRWLEAECMVQSGFGKKIASVRKVRSL